MKKLLLLFALFCTACSGSDSSFEEPVVDPTWPGMNVGAEAMTLPDLELMTETGITQIRVPLWWAWWHGEQEDRWRDFIALTDSAEVEVLGVLNAPPQEYRLGSGVVEFTDFAVARSKEFPSVKAWQIMNEFGDHSPFIWGDSATSETDRARAYATLLCHTYEALKLVDPEDLVVTIAMTPREEFLDEFTRLGGWNCTDVVSIHNYDLPLDVSLAAWIIRLRQYTDKPIWVTETGRLVADDAEHLRIWQEAADASKRDIERWYGFTWKSAEPWGVLRGDNTPRPTLDWLQEWHQQM